MKIREMVLAILHVLLQEVNMPGALFIRQVMCLEKNTLILHKPCLPP